MGGWLLIVKLRIIILPALDVFIGLAVFSKQNDRRLAGRFLVMQAVVALWFVCAFGLLSGKNAFYSALWGGLCGVLPNGIAAWMMFKKSGAREARRILSGFYLGEALKFLMTVILVVIAIREYRVSMLPFLLTYTGVILTVWLSPIVMK